MTRHHPQSPDSPAGTAGRFVKLGRFGRPALPIAMAGALSSCSSADVGRTVWPWPRLHLLPVIALAALAVLSSCGSSSNSEAATRGSTEHPTTMPTTATVETTATVDTTRTTPRPSSVIDEGVTVGGAVVHLRCEGSGPATVVLIAGFEADGTGWNAVTEDVAATSRVCTYDRPGTGQSSPAAEVMTFGTQAEMLHAVLEAAGEPGPYIAVGHSFGGPEAVEFARRFPSEVDGLALVDASPFGWPDALCAIPADGTAAAASIRSMCDGWADPVANVEHLDVINAFRALAGTTTLGSLPLEVLTAVDRELPPDIASAERARITEAWDAGQQRWAQLSSAGHLTTVGHTSHHIQIDQPAVVVAAIERLLP